MGNKGYTENYRERFFVFCFSFFLLFKDGKRYKNCNARENHVAASKIKQKMTKRQTCKYIALILPKMRFQECD
jgi:hypothetical protein